MFKVILTTISATAVIIFFVASFFLNSILGLFNLATIPLSLLPEFHQSKQIIKNLKASNSVHRNKIDTIKKRHKTKNLNASKRFSQRSSKKIALSAITAGTIGTVGVVFTVAGLEVYDYCEDKQELLKDENILFDTNKKFNYKTCLDEATKDSKKIITLVKEPIKNAWNETKDFSQKQWQEVVEEFDNIWKKTKDFSE